MNKSELIILKQLSIIDDLKEENMKLKDKIEQLQDRKDTLEIRIDKAIKYIEKNASFNDFRNMCEGLLKYYECNELLDILKGDNK